MGEIRMSFFLILGALAAAAAASNPMIYSARLIDRFAEEVRNDNWTVETTSFLMENDAKRLGGARRPNQTLVASRTYSFGNDMGWLHYMWAEIGTPNVSFLVALDTGSDMFWLPCNCTSCAPLSASCYNMLDKDLPQYSPSRSNTSKAVPCSHRVCKKASVCGSPKGPCPYLAQYQFEDTSSSGFLFEDVFHLPTIVENKQQSSVQASIIIGCGSNQTGAYLQGFAPDGVMGLGPSGISVPSMLAKSGLIRHAYSFCYNEVGSGRLYFGDQGPASQLSTTLKPLKKYRNKYVVEVDHCCIESSCLKHTGFRAQVDTGTSFTYLPSEIHKQVVSEFERQVNSSSVRKGSFESCFQTSLLHKSNIPSLKLVFAMNQSFLIENLMLRVADNLGSFYCLVMQPIEGDIGIIGQNFMMGYRIVFDWEKMKLGWSNSRNCHGIGPDTYALTQQQRPPKWHVVAPACIASRGTGPDYAWPQEQGGPQWHVVAPASISSLLLSLCITYVINYVI